MLKTGYHSVSKWFSQKICSVELDFEWYEASTVRSNNVILSGGLLVLIDGISGDMRLRSIPE